MDNYNIVYQHEAIEFVTVAKEFVAFLENAREYNKAKFIDHAMKILPLLYLKGTLLPAINDYDEDYIEKFVDEATWSYVQQTTAAKLEEDDEYIQLNDCMVSTMDTMSVGLSEIFADLYQEMADLIGAYRLTNDNIMLAALACCKYNFSHYWGIRTLALLKALHEIKFRNEDASDL